MEKSDIFPIQRNVVYHQKSYKKSLNKGTMLKCVFCGQKFKLEQNNVSIALNDGMQMVQCPYCDRKASCLYYFDQEVSKEALMKPLRQKRNGFQRNLRSMT